ncbi:ATP-binding protein [Microbispora sp. H11081]|uniref:ATP-binding protein n=1 Tax=Microbispora sp. H11081 TaxID=2729107 RepID=UPI0014730B6E|nr:ATP-binding protein [Microbispora sp. H11081]
MLTSPFPAEDGLRTALKVLGSAATAPRRARAFVRSQLRGWELGHLAETAELVVSELVTNAVRATAAVVSPPVAASMFPVPLRTVALRVRESSGRGSLFIEVWDVSEREPVRPDGAVGDAGGDPGGAVERELGEGGRGLALVGDLARSWGHYPAPDRGKIVWCELAIVPADAARQACPPGAQDAGSMRCERQSPAGELPRRVRRHPVGVRADGPDEATLLRVLQGLRALDVRG